MALNQEENWNEDVLEGVETGDLSSLIVFSRDWTIETIFNQIKQGNIDLNPQFQRRNAWTDDKRSRLIESLIIGIPVPEVVLAEHPDKKKSFIVIDGKQRLLTIEGFIDPEIQYWKRPTLGKLDMRQDLTGIDFNQLKQQSKFEDEYREFMNADIRCTIISNYSQDDILYDIFYRLNSGSVPLSTQELRQVLNKGSFADYLMEITNDLQPIHTALNLQEPDARLRDVEMVLRFISFTLFGKEFTGNLKKFLDNTMKQITKKWSHYKEEVSDIYTQFNDSIELLFLSFGHSRVGHKFNNGKWEGVFNKVLFEVEVYYFRFLTREEVEARKDQFVEAFKEFCDTNVDFKESISLATSNLENYQKRFSLFRDFVSEVFGRKIGDIPVSLKE